MVALSIFNMIPLFYQFPVLLERYSYQVIYAPLLGHFNCYEHKVCLLGCVCLDDYHPITELYGTHLGLSIFVYVYRLILHVR
jgi:hypothetical protein